MPRLKSCFHLSDATRIRNDEAMAESSYQLGVFLHLAQASLRRRRPLVRDRMLLLAGATAANLQLNKLAHYCRQEILRHNPRHLVGRWPTFAEALIDQEFLTFIVSLRRRYPVERAERLLDTLGIEIANERDTYYSDAEYAAAILSINADLVTEDEDRGQAG